MSERRQETGFGAPGQYYYKDGEATVQRTDHTIKATLGGLAQWILVRKQQILERKAEANIQYNLEKSTIALTIGEHGRYREAEAGATKELIPVVNIIGSAETSPELAIIQEIVNSGESFSPRKLGKELRNIIHLFRNEQEYDQLYKDLMNFSATVEKLYVDTQSEVGDKRVKKIEAQLKDAKVLKAYFNIPILVGGANIEVSAGLIYEIEGNGIEMSMISPRLGGQIKQAKEDAITVTLKAIQESLGSELPIVEQN